MIVIKEKFSLISELMKKQKELTGDKKLSLMGIGDFPGASSLMRSTMNTKHHSQHLTIDNPEFPFIFNGSENLFGEHSSYYFRTDREYKVIRVIKKYGELLKGRSYMSLYFLHCPEDDSYTVVERKECENLVEIFGFDYDNEYLDQLEEGDRIPANTVLYHTTSYDDDMNVGIGVNGLILYGVHPAVQDDAIVISESFSKRMVTNQVTSKTIPVNENTVFINLYGDEKNYQGLPNIGDRISNGIVAATRTVKETRMFSDLRDSSLTSINQSSDHVYYGEGEVIDINIYCNNPKLKVNKLNAQLVQYYNDQKFFYSEVYRTCRKIINSGSKKIDPEIYYWSRRAKEYLDEDAKWDFNDNVFSNMMVQILLRKKKPLLVGDKITGRYGNKTVVSQIVPDDQMPFITSESYTDQYGRVQPAGKRIPIELVTNPLAIINRTIPMALFEASMTFILARTKEHMATMEKAQEAIDFMFDVISEFNKEYADHMRAIYDSLTDRQKKEFLDSCLNHWMGVPKKSFDPELCLRDAIIRIYDKYANIMQPYNLFIPKREWVDPEHPNGRDIYVGKYHIGYQYIMVLKQIAERGFSVRSAGAISDESLPEKSNENKIGKLWHSDTPIKFGEWSDDMFTLNLINCGNEDYESLATRLVAA